MCPVAIVPSGIFAAGHIADNAVTAAKIPDNVLTATMLPDNVILATHIPNATAPTFANTTVTGTLDVTGVISPTTHIDMPDDAYLKIGTGDDLQIYHSGTYNRNYIQATGSNHDLTIAGDEIALTNSAISETFATFVADGAVTLKYDNSTKIATASGGVTVTGDTVSNASGGVITLGANGHITSKQSLDVATAGGRLI
jgi:hypothetical protein